MDSKWEDIKLGEILELITDYHSNGSYETLKENVELLDKKDFAIMIRTTNFEQNSFSENLKYISERSYSFLKKSIVYHGDIIMNKIANAGSVYFMPNLNYPVSLAMNLFLLRINKEKANQHFVFYYLKANESYVKQFAEGSVTKTITKNAVRNLIVKMPSIEIQDKIVTIIESLESKIDNLRRQNETLEAIAQTLFKHWFIDFEFPDADGKPYKSSGGGMWRSAIGDIPEGWHIGKLGDIGENIREGVKESDIRPDMSYIGLEHIPRKQIALDTWEQAVDVASNKFWFNKGNILFGKLRPYFHKVGVAFTSGVCSTDILVIDSKQETYFGFLLMLLSSEQFIYYVSLASEGTRMPRTSWEYMKDYSVVIPTSLVLKDFNELLKILIKKMEINIFQIQTLTKTRGALLPKLMSGQLRVKE